MTQKNMLKRSKAFPVPQTGSKPRPSMKEIAGFLMNRKKPMNNSSMEGGS